MSIFENDIFIITLISVLFIVSFIFWLSVYFVVSRFKSLTNPVYEQIIEKANSDASKINQKAREEADSVKSEAVKSANEYLIEAKGGAELIRQKFEQELESVGSEFRNSIVSQNQNLVNFFTEQKAVFKKSIDDSVNSVSNDVLSKVESIKSNIEEVTKKLEQEINSIKDTEAENFKTVISKELEESKRQIADYRNERLRLVDEQIALLVEKTTQITLKRSLSADQHADIIKQALEEAKEGGAF